MENNEAYTERQTQTAEAEKKAGAENTVSGKFKDVRSLYEAYGALESEFTKRCQRIKALEGEIALLRDKEGSHSEATVLSPQGERATEKTEDENAKAFLAKRTGDDFSDRSAEKTGEVQGTEKEVQGTPELLEETQGACGQERVRDPEEIRESAVRDYVKSVLRNNSDVPVLTDVGQVAIAPPVRARNIEEAGQLAERLFRQNTF